MKAKYGPEEPTGLPRISKLMAKRRAKQLMETIEAEHLPLERREDRRKALELYEAKQARAGLITAEVEYYTDMAVDILTREGKRSFRQAMEAKGIPEEDARKIYQLATDRMRDENATQVEAYQDLSLARLEDMYKRATQVGKLPIALKIHGEIDARMGLTTSDNPDTPKSYADAVKEAALTNPTQIQNEPT